MNALVGGSVENSFRITFDKGVSIPHLGPSQNYWLRPRFSRSLERNFRTFCTPIIRRSTSPTQMELMSEFFSDGIQRVIHSEGSKGTMVVAVSFAMYATHAQRLTEDCSKKSEDVALRSHFNLISRDKLEVSWRRCQSLVH